MAQGTSPNTRKLLSVVIVIAVVVGGAALIISLGGNDGDDGKGPGGKLEEGWKPYAVFPNTKVTDLDTANNEPGLAVNPTNPLNIVAGSNDYGTPSGDAWCGYYYTFDGGETWDRGLIPGYDGDRSSPLWPFAGGGDPVVVFGQDGTCYLAGIAFQREPELGNIRKPGSSIFVARSDDGGRTFGMVSIVIQSISSLSNMFANFHDKEWIAVDPTTNDVHITWTAFQLYGVSSAMVHSVSTDRGETWSRPQIISEITRKERQVQGSQVEVDLDGIVHVSWIEYDMQTLRYTRSTNSGQSFETVRTIASVTPLEYYLPNGDYRTPTMCDMAVDTSGGNLSGSIYIAWPDHRTGQGDILLTSSHDGGDTWTEPVKVNNATQARDNDQFFPATTVGYDGSIQIMFYDRRDDPDNDLIGVYFAISYDGGKTFQNIKMCDVPFDGDNTRGPFIGDYLALSSGPGWTVGIWCDAREGTKDNVRSDIWMGKIIYDEELLPEEQPA
ncbi:MAG: sialidase family protein [Candidatus Thermoplasmatota archaeon]|nr:sialidase family protein [Candidatus Thermoplasmatota archaeon]